MTSTTDTTDRIEREILVAAPIDRVWALVAEPGWWIGGGDPARRVTRRHDGVVVVAVPPYGRFPVRPVTTAAPYHAAFRSGDDPDRPLTEATSTLVEFALSERGDRTLVRLVESGFASLYLSAERCGGDEDDDSGWTRQLDLLRLAAESGGTATPT